MVVPATSWAQCQDSESQIVTQHAFGLDVSPDRSWAAVGVAGARADGLPHVEITSSAQVMDHRPGVDWVIPRMAQLAARWPDARVVIASGSAAESLVPALTEAGVTVDFVKAGDINAACGLFFDLATTTGLRHIGQAELTDALGTARKNQEDGEGAWRWGRRRSTADITPLYAVTLALWDHVAHVGGNIMDSVW